MINRRPAGVFGKAMLTTRLLSLLLRVQIAADIKIILKIEKLMSTSHKMDYTWPNEYNIHGVTREWQLIRGLVAGGR